VQYRGSKTNHPDPTIGECSIGGCGIGGSCVVVVFLMELCRRRLRLCYHMRKKIDG